MTAVEWLIQQMKNGNFNSSYTKGRWNITYPANMGSPLEVAKQMEKQQIIDAYHAAINLEYSLDMQSPIEYYNETYKK